jgi:hypothetical protein
MRNRMSAPMPPQMPYMVQDRWSMYRPENYGGLNKEAEYLNQMVAQQELPPPTPTPPPPPAPVEQPQPQLQPEPQPQLQPEPQPQSQPQPQLQPNPQLQPQPQVVNSEKEIVSSQDSDLTPESFTDVILPEWRDVQVTKREKFLKEFMMKFLAYQVVEAHHSSEIDKAFWNWCFGLFPCSSTSSSRFKQYSDIWISFLCFKKKFWKQFNKWYLNCNHTVIEEAKNDYLREKLKI